MASAGADIETAAVAHEKAVTATETPTMPKSEDIDSDSLRGPNGEIYPTDEEMDTLRRVHGKVNWLIYTIGIVEMVERFAYYGTTAVCQLPLTPSDSIFQS